MGVFRDEGNGTILQTLSGGSGGLSAAHTYTFEVEGTARGNTYTTWPETWAAASADPADEKRIVVDTTLTTWLEAEIPAGVWDMTGIELYFDDRRPPGNTPYIYALSGCRMPGLQTMAAASYTVPGRRCQGVWFFYGDPTTPMVTYSSPVEISIIGVSLSPDFPPNPIFRFDNCTVGSGGVDFNIVSGYTSWGSFWFQDNNAIPVHVYDNLYDEVNWNPYIEPGAFQGAGSGNRAVYLVLMDSGVSRFWLYPQHWMHPAYGLTSVRTEPFFILDPQAIGASFELATDLQVGLAGRMVFTFVAGAAGAGDTLVIRDGYSWIDLEITDVQLILTTPGSAGATAQAWLSHNGGSGTYARLSELFAADAAAGRYRDSSTNLPRVQTFTRSLKLVRGTHADFAGKVIIDFMGKKG